MNWVYRNHTNVNQAQVGALLCECEEVVDFAEQTNLLEVANVLASTGGNIGQDLEGRRAAKEIIWAELVDQSLDEGIEFVVVLEIGQHHHRAGELEDVRTFD